jgi:TetR/AcrR family transcriptional repressor of nem operon
MHAHGYAAVGVKELCERAGVSRGSFYHFFPSKRDLALAVLDGRWDVFKEQMLEPAFSEDVPTSEKLRRLFVGAFEFQRALKDATGLTQGCPFGNLALELSAQDDVIQGKIQEVFERLTGRFEEVLREGESSGELPAMDTERTAQAVLAYLEGAFLLAKTYDDPSVMERLAEGVNHLVIPARV